MKFIASQTTRSYEVQGFQPLLRVEHDLVCVDEDHSLCSITWQASPGKDSQTLSFSDNDSILDIFTSATTR